MRDAETTTPDLESTVERLGPVAAVVGVVTLNNAETVDGVLRAARRGAQLNGAPRTLVVHADGGSKEGTVTRAAAALREDGGLPPSVSLPDPAMPRYGRELARAGAMRGILLLAQRLGARGCAVLDGALLGAAPEWVGRLLRPVLEDGIDFVAPYYQRPRFAGAITSSIVYPMTRALYGKRVRFPIAEDFACSPGLVDRVLKPDAVWENELPRTGPEVWLGTQALVGGFRLRQVVLGDKLPPEIAAEDLPATLSRVLGALFAEVERNLTVWQKVRGSEPVELSGSVPVTDPGTAPIDVKRALDGFRLGQDNLRDIWGLVLPPLTLLELKKLARQQDAAFRFPDALWARILYDFALAYRVRTLNRDHLLAAFTPLYLGWLGSFVSEEGASDARALESRIEQLCLRYESEKPYLISRWRWPDRFNP